MVYKNISPTYACVLSKKLQNNFFTNKFYLIYKLSYEKHKEYIDKAESLITGVYLTEKKATEQHIPIHITPEYISRIKGKGTFSAKYDKDNKKFILSNIKLNSGEKHDIEFEERLENALTVQEIKFNAKSGLDHLITNNDWFFIEIDKINYTNSDILYLEKKLYDLVIKYDENGNIINDSGINQYRYFKITDNIFFDLENNSFIKDGIPNYKLGNDKKEILYKFLKILINNSGIRIPNEEIIEKLKEETGEKNIMVSDLSSYKRQLESYFEKILKVNNDGNEIISCIKRQGYLINGEFFEKI